MTNLMQWTHTTVGLKDLCLAATPLPCAVMTAAPSLVNTASLRPVMAVILHCGFASIRFTIASAFAESASSNIS